MKQLILGIVLGISLTAGATDAFHTTEHGFYDQIERDRDRAIQDQERWDQRQFRNEQQLRNMIPRMPC